MTFRRENKPFKLLVFQGPGRLNEIPSKNFQPLGIPPLCRCLEMLPLTLALAAAFLVNLALATGEDEKLGLFEDLPRAREADYYDLRIFIYEPWEIG